MTGRYQLTPVPALVQHNTKGFRLSGGGYSEFKFDCDALTDEDWLGVAAWLRTLLPPFASVEGIPRGGRKLAEALRPHCELRCQPHYHLIVDDVLTTGGSMERAKAAYALDGDTYPTQKLCVG